MLRIEMLPAAHGDCLWVEYGTGEEVRRVLIDGGPAHTYPALRERVLHLPAGDRRFELLVVTHIDCDHIDGIVRLLQDAETLGCTFERIWFNGRKELNEVPDEAEQPLGATQGEYLSLLIADYEERVGRAVLNRDFPGGFVAVDRKEAALPEVPLPGDMSLTILSPDHGRLLALKDHWEEALERAGIEPADERDLRRRLEASRTLRPLGDVLGEEEEEEGFEVPTPDDADLDVALADELGGEAAPGSDASVANGSSIAFLAEHHGRRVLFAGDAWAGVLGESIATVVGEDGALDLDVFKVPHHGSVANVSEGLLSRMRAKHYLVSTSGAIFRHPHTECIDLLLEHHAHRARPRLHFNYRTVTTEPWASEADQRARRYEAFHPKGTSILL